MFRTTASPIGLLSILLLLAAGAPAGAQQAPPPTRSSLEAQARLRTADSATTYLIATRDGSSFFGRVQAVRGDSVVITTGGGSLTIGLERVVSAKMVRAEDIRDGEYWFPNPNTTRLLFAPTGRSLRRGSGYFSDYLVFLPGVAYGITDRVAVGGGMSVIPGVGLDEQLFYLTPKVGIIARENVNVAVGALALRLGLGSGDGVDRDAGIVYTVGTFGNPNASMTAGIGFGYAGGQMEDSPAIMIGGDARLSRRFGLVSENYYFSGLSDNALVSLGGRFFGEKMAVDFGLVGALGESDIAPFVGFVVNF